MAFLQQLMMAGHQSTPAPQTSSQPELESPLSPARRTRRQLGLFFAGAAFFGVAQAITRRSIVRRYKATLPKFYQPSNRLNYDVNGAMEAFEALNIATINVFSLGIMMSGGLMWAFDVATVQDMRSKVRANLGVDTIRTDQDAEEEIEEWFATVLARKEFKALRGDKGISDEDLEKKIKAAEAKREAAEKKS